MSDSAGDTAGENDEISFVSPRHSAGDTAGVETNEETKNPCKNLLGTRITLLTKDQVLIEYVGRERPVCDITLVQVSKITFENIEGILQRPPSRRPPKLVIM